MVLNDAWIAANYRNLVCGAATGTEDLVGSVSQNLFVVLSHEAGHQFGHTHPEGAEDGCGGIRRHAPYGSGSVTRYGHLKGGGSVRHYVTEEAIRLVPNATWKSDSRDQYWFPKAGAPASIDRWGVWIIHELSGDGKTAPGQLWGGDLSIVDKIGGYGLVRGRPADRISLASDAAWSGEDNFLGVDSGPSYLGALLRADGNLRYTFGDRPNLNLRVNNFEAHYSAGDNAAVWHDHDFTDWGRLQLQHGLLARRQRLFG